MLQVDAEELVAGNYPTNLADVPILWITLIKLAGGRVPLVEKVLHEVAKQLIALVLSQATPPHAPVSGRPSQILGKRGVGKRVLAHQLWHFVAACDCVDQPLRFTDAVGRRIGQGRLHQSKGDKGDWKAGDESLERQRLRRNAGGSAPRPAICRGVRSRTPSPPPRCSYSYKRRCRPRSPATCGQFRRR